ncbi:MAG: TIGR02584 family CRISPR-associated protein [bacterium]|nr:TIGR02584 family CRISPR-associated protein [bacterium]
MEFGPNNIHVITDDSGRQIEDIRDEDDNEQLLKLCLDLTFKLTADSQTAVFFLVAGGRKTMSSCLTLAAQLYGRPQDRIYHVLVSPEFENNRNFFYPPPVPIEIELRDQKGDRYIKKTSYAQISLICVPFVSIRDRLADRWLNEPQDPATLMLSLIRDEHPTLTIDLSEQKLIYKRIELDLPPSLLALYTFFAQQKKNCPLKKASCRDCQKCFLTIQEIFKAQDKLDKLYRRIKSKSYSPPPLTHSPLPSNISNLDAETHHHDDWHHLDWHHRSAAATPPSSINSLDAETFNQYKAKIRKKIIQQFGGSILRLLEISSVGHKPDTRYGLLLDKRWIRILPDE